MFGIDSSELAVVALLALIFIGPKDLPKVMRAVGHWTGKARAASRHFKSGVKSMLREAELEDLRQKANRSDRLSGSHPSAVEPPNAL